MNEQQCYTCGSIQGRSDCMCCVALNRCKGFAPNKPMHQRIAEARTVVDSFGGTPVNIVYLGEREYAEVLRDAQTYPTGGKVLQVRNINGLRIVRVRLGSWLQVAYTEGAK